MLIHKFKVLLISIFALLVLPLANADNGFYTDVKKMRTYLNQLPSDLQVNWLTDFRKFLVQPHMCPSLQQCYQNSFPKIICAMQKGNLVQKFCRKGPVSFCSECYGLSNVLLLLQRCQQQGKRCSPMLYFMLHSDVNTLKGYLSAID